MNGSYTFSKLAFKKDFASHILAAAGRPSPTPDRRWRPRRRVDSSGPVRKQMETVRVAVCLAGAARQWTLSATSFVRYVISPLRAHVYAALEAAAADQRGSSTPSRASQGSRSGRSAQKVALVELRQHLGGAMRGALLLADDDLSPSGIGRWAGAAAVNASSVAYAWRYYLKRWACHRLIAAAPNDTYEVVITMRPDLTFFQPWAIERAKDDAHFRLRVGSDAKVRFGEGDVLLHDFTYACSNDWLTVSTFAASATLEQTIHHLHSARAFAPCEKLVGTPSTCCEILFSAWLWRTGLRRQLVDLHVDMSRMIQSCPDCYSTFFPNNSQAEFRVRRRSNRSGTAAMHSRYGQRMQEYCSRDQSHAFDHSGDSFVLKLSNQPAGTKPSVEPAAGGALSSLGLARRFCTSTFPPCADAVDLRQRMQPCVRRDLEQRLPTIRGGYGKDMLACKDRPDGMCDSLRLAKAMYVS